MTMTTLCVLCVYSFIFDGCLGFAAPGNDHHWGEGRIVVVAALGRVANLFNLARNAAEMIRLASRHFGQTGRIDRARMPFARALAVEAF